MKILIFEISKWSQNAMWTYFVNQGRKQSALLLWFTPQQGIHGLKATRKCKKASTTSYHIDIS